MCVNARRIVKEQIIPVTEVPENGGLEWESVSLSLSEMVQNTEIQNSSINSFLLCQLCINLIYH